MKIDTGKSIETRTGKRYHDEFHDRYPNSHMIDSYYIIDGDCSLTQQLEWAKSNISDDALVMFNSPKINLPINEVQLRWYCANINDAMAIKLRWA